MTYRFIYDDQYFRTIPGVIIDARKGTPLANQIGSVIKAYTDAQVALVTNMAIPYKVETNNGNLAGFFVLQVNSGGATVSLQQSVLRPAFQGDNSTISAQIVNFIQNNGWQADFLF